jgi:tRNA (guanine37-N1)-methyltransferase
MWQVNVFTIFPEAFPGNLGVSIIGRAIRQSIWNLNLIHLKRFPVKSDRIDFPPCGGGAGMILSPITFDLAFNTLSAEAKQMRRIYFSPRGRQLEQKDLTEISQSEGITMLCGRYEGVDQRILDIYGMEEISIGDFVLLGGEAAAMVIIEGCVRLLPGVVGENESISNDSFQQNLLEHDQYTTPRIFRENSVPELLFSGNHRKIEEFRHNQSKIRTIFRRPDLWARFISESMSKKRGIN